MYMLCVTSLKTSSDVDAYVLACNFMLDDVIRSVPVLAGRRSRAAREYVMSTINDLVVVTPAVAYPLWRRQMPRPNTTSAGEDFMNENSIKLPSYIAIRLWAI